MINARSVKVKLSDMTDLLASRVSWKPAKPGGANFKTRELVAVGGKLIVKRTFGATQVFLVVAFMGLVPLVIGLPYCLVKGLFAMGLSLLGWGAFWGGMGIALLYVSAPMTFDGTRGVYYRGKKFRPLGSERGVDYGYFRDIHAIQLLAERIKPVEDTRPAYTSYELNLVLKNGKRVNIMDHGNDGAVLDAAKQLATLLKVRIWRATTKGQPSK